jgi:hypothetical protein
MTPPRVLCYAPYNRWALHGRWEMTILQALKLRGADVQYVLCDGLYTDCDQFWGVVAPRPANACTMCQMQVTKLVAEMGMDFHWLGRYLTTDEGREARRWADSLAAGELKTATYGEWRVGEWVRASVQSHFRSNELDHADPAVERVLRSYAYSALIACFALDRLLAESAPDVLLLFNGRQSSTRVALELARARGIRVIVHERGLRHETLKLIENASCLSLEHVRRYWREWGDVPLTGEELEAIARLMAEREHGRELPWTAFTAAPQPREEVLAKLGLRPDRPTWVLFTSSDDEVAGDADWGSAFASQSDWIRRTIDHAGRSPEIDLVIRVHPNTGSRRSQGANRVQLDEMQRIGADLPPNVRIIDPEDEVSSYSLMDIAAVGLVWVSTVGVEMACKGKEVVVAAGNYVHGTPFVRTVLGPATYERMLESLTAVPPAAVSPEIRRLALRHAYGLFFRTGIPFPLVRMTTALDSELAYSSLDALRPGRDAGVDRCARILLEGEAVCPPPTEAERARSTEDEDAFLAGFGRRRLTALAFADELIADGTLLQAWADAFDGRDDVTLLIHTPVADTDRLVAAVTRAGLDREDGPDLLAEEVDADAMAFVDAVFSRAAVSGALAGAPRFDAESVGELAVMA